jgi:hypothetical protein
MVETLEDRVMLASVVWDGGGDGVNWTDESNWDTDQLPGFQDDVVIAVDGDISVALGSGEQNIRSLDCQEYLTISGGTLNLDAASAIKSLSLGATLWVDGDLNIAKSMTWGAGSGNRTTMGGTGTTTILSGATLTVGPGTNVLDARTLEISSGVSASIQDNAVIYLNNASRLINAGALEINSTVSGIRTEEGIAGTFTNSGKIQKLGSGDTNVHYLANTTTGVVEVSAGALGLGRMGSTQAGQFIAEAATSLSFSGLPAADVTFTDESVVRNHGVVTFRSPTIMIGSLLLEDGIVLSSYPVVLDGGHLEGMGTISGDVLNSGITSPGLPYGTIEITGTYNQSPSGTLDIELSELTSGISDRLAVNGTVSLDGVLNVSISTETTPALGDTFLIIENDGSADSVIGSFDHH